MSGVSANALDVRGLSTGYGSVRVLNDVDLDVASGEVVALLGANGAGKTTLLLAVASILRPWSGEVALHGNVVEQGAHRLARGGLTLVLDRNLFMKQTVEENLRVGRVDPDRAFEFFPVLRRLAKRRAGLLSGGEQKMLSLGRALASDPTVLLVDEVSLGLAPVVVGPLLDAIRHAADQGLAVLLVEQQARRALAVADRGYVLNQGRVVLQGTAADLHTDLDKVTRAYLA